MNITSAARFLIVGAALMVLGLVGALGQATGPSDGAAITIESAPEMEVVSFSKSVIVKKEAKGVLVFGADAIIEGRVEGDVAVIGGSIIQHEGGYIGGDVIVVGGKYSPVRQVPLRGDKKETIVIAAYEEELRNFAQNPSLLFSPTFSVAFFAQRLVSVLFWFLISLAFTTIAPGAVGRAVAKMHLSMGKIFGFGLFAFLGFSILLIAGVATLPSYVSAAAGAMGLVVLTLAYVFGRVALHVALGKMIKKHFLSERNRSEALTVLFGVLAWTVIFSVPYVWTFALLAAFSAGIGLVLTARRTPSLDPH